jgi:hypothetical protein
VTARLADELGIDPGVELRSAHAQVLRQEQQPVQPPVARPAQLPMDLANFGGRRAELTKMRESLTCAERPMTIAAIDGMPGAGKTTVAVHLAHALVDRYPDGQLYACVGTDRTGHGGGRNCGRHPGQTEQSSRS